MALTVPTGLVAGLPCGFTAGLVPFGAGLVAGLLPVGAGLAVVDAAFEAGVVDDAADVAFEVVLVAAVDVVDVDAFEVLLVEVVVLDVLELAGTLVRLDQQLLLAAQGEVPIWL